MLRRRAISLSVTALVLAACAGTPPLGATPPDDFALAVTLLGTSAEGPEALRPAWYIVEPDGTLRVALGERRPISPPPRPVRRLSHRDRQALWADAADLAAAGAPVSEGPADLADPTPHALVYLAAGGERRTVRIDLERGGETVARVADRLRRLGWVDR